MRDPLALHHERALEILDRHLSDTYAAELLTKKQLAEYQWKTAVEGWRCRVNGYEVDLIVDTEFPHKIPKVFIPGRSRALEWPHVGSDNNLCVTSAQDTHDPDDPTGVADHLLSQAALLIDQIRSGHLQDDFRDEFLSYWEIGLRNERRDFVLLFEPDKTSREIAWWPGNKRAYIAETAIAGSQWLERYHKSKQDRSPDRFRRGLLIWLEEPLYPPYPSNANELLQLIRSVTQEELLIGITGDRPDIIPVIFAFEVNNGTALAGTWIKAPATSNGPRRQHAALYDGFRPGRIPKNILLNRYMAGMAIDRVYVHRADPAWIHSRGGSNLYNSLATKHITIIGCGSIGAEVAHLLAQSGISQLTLIDHDVLTWDNVGRHYLGGSDNIDSAKVTALKSDLQGKFPHITISTHRDRWQNVWDKSPELLANTDCIISAIGDWSSEAALNYLARKTASFPTIIFSWVEHHASAAHALVVKETGGCLMCGMTSTGQFLFQAVEWDDDPTVRVPACGGHYQPYGAIDLSPAHHLTASTALDLLSGKILHSQHRVWFGDRLRIESMGGRWATTWISPANHPGDGLTIVKRPWPVRCGYCRQ